MFLMHYLQRSPVRSIKIYNLSVQRRSSCKRTVLSILYLYNSIYTCLTCSPTSCCALHHLVAILLIPIRKQFSVLSFAVFPRSLTKKPKNNNNISHNLAPNGKHIICITPLPRAPSLQIQKYLFFANQLTFFLQLFTPQCRVAKKVTTTKME